MCVFFKFYIQEHACEILPPSLNHMVMPVILHPLTLVSFKLAELMVLGVVVVVVIVSGIFDRDILLSASLAAPYMLHRVV